MQEKGECNVEKEICKLAQVMMLVKHIVTGLIIKDKRERDDSRLFRSCYEWK